MTACTAVFKFRRKPSRPSVPFLPSSCSDHLWSLSFTFAFLPSSCSDHLWSPSFTLALVPVCRPDGKVATLAVVPACGLMIESFGSLGLVFVKTGGESIGEAVTGEGVVILLLRLAPCRRAHNRQEQSLSTLHTRGTGHKPVLCRLSRIRNVLSHAVARLLNLLMNYPQSPHRRHDCGLANQLTSPPPSRRVLFNQLSFESCIPSNTGQHPSAVALRRGGKMHPTLSQFAGAFQCT